MDFADFDADRRQVIESCAQLSINKLVVPGTQANSWLKLLQLSEQYTALKPALGLHPYFLQQFNDSDFALLAQLLARYSDKITAVGEIGLDYALDISHDIQMMVFSKQLSIATEFGLPVILHHRRSHNDLIKTLKQQRYEWGGIVHAFSGSLYEANTYIELGFKLGIGGVITYPRARKTREVVSQLPLSALVLETDSPDMPPQGKQGLRNNPQNLLLILDELCLLRQESREDIIVQCQQNVVAALRNMN